MNDKKAEISIEEAKHIAHLARLPLTTTELEKIRAELATVLDYVSKIQELDTTKVVPTHHATGTKNVWREDELTRRDDHTEKFLANAPKTEGSQLKVQTVIEDKE